MLHHRALGRDLDKLVIAVVDNRRAIATACTKAGVAIGLDGLRSDWAEQLQQGLGRLTDPAVRRALADAGPRALNGHGATRAAREIERRWGEVGRTTPPGAAVRSPGTG